MAGTEENVERGVSTLELFTDLPMLLGVVVFAAGVKTAIAHAFEPVTPEMAIALALGAALYLLGNVLFRLSIGMGRTLGRARAAAACLTAIPIGRPSVRWSSWPSSWRSS